MISASDRFRAKSAWRSAWDTIGWGREPFVRLFGCNGYLRLNIYSRLGKVLNAHGRPLRQDWGDLFNESVRALKHARTSPREFHDKSCDRRDDYVTAVLELGVPCTLELFRTFVCAYMWKTVVNNMISQIARPHLVQLDVDKGLTSRPAGRALDASDSAMFQEIVELVARELIAARRDKPGLYEMIWLRYSQSMEFESIAPRVGMKAGKTPWERVRNFRRWLHARILRHLRIDLSPAAQETALDEDPLNNLLDNYIEWPPSLCEDPRPRLPFSGEHS